MAEPASVQQGAVFLAGMSSLRFKGEWPHLTGMCELVVKFQEEPIHLAIDRHGSRGREVFYRCFQPTEANAASAAQR